MTKYTFAQLKEMLQTKTEKAHHSFSLVSSGIPQGAITAITGFGKTELVVQFLKEHAHLPVAWIEESFSLFPFGVFQRELKLDRFLFIEAGNDTAWSLHQILKAQIHSIVVYYRESEDEKSLRKIQIAAERAGASVLWLTKEQSHHWSVSLEIQAYRDLSSINANVNRRRY